LAREVGASEGQGIWAVFFFAIYPPLISYTADLSTAVPETMFVILGIWSVLRIARSPSTWPAVATGLSLGLATLTRSTWLVMFPTAALWLGWFYHWAWGKWLRVLLFFGGAVALVLAPWVFYNYNAHGKIILTSTNGGVNFWIGNNLQATGEYLFPRQIDQVLVSSTAEMTEVERDAFFYRQGFSFVRDHPDKFLSLFGRKLLYFFFFRPNIGSNYESATFALFALVQLSFIVSWVGLLLLAMPGFLASRDSWREYSWFVVIFISQAIISGLYFSGSRFRTPIDGLVMVWAAIGLTVLWERFTRRGQSTGV